MALKAKTITTENPYNDLEIKTEKEIVKVEKPKKQKKQKKEKKGNIFSKIGAYLRDVGKEMHNVRWPSKKEMLLYSGATLGFIVIFALFFMLNDVVISAVKQLVR